MHLACREKWMFVLVNHGDTYLTDLNTAFVFMFTLCYVPLLTDCFPVCFSLRLNGYWLPFVTNKRGVFLPPLPLCFLFEIKHEFHLVWDSFFMFSISGSVIGNTSATAKYFTAGSHPGSNDHLILLWEEPNWFCTDFILRQVVVPADVLSFPLRSPLNKATKNNVRQYCFFFLFSKHALYQQLIQMHRGNFKSGFNLQALAEILKPRCCINGRKNTMVQFHKPR